MEVSQCSRLPLGIPNPRLSVANISNPNLGQAASKNLDVQDNGHVIV
jgi:hypothetical protein